MLSDEQFAVLQEQNRAAHEKQQETLRVLAETLLTMERRVTEIEAERHAHEISEDANQKANRKGDERQRMWRSAVLALIQGGSVDLDSIAPVQGGDGEGVRAVATSIARFADAIVAEDDKRVP